MTNASDIKQKLDYIGRSLECFGGDWHDLDAEHLVTSLHDIVKDLHEAVVLIVDNAGGAGDES